MPPDPKATPDYKLAPQPLSSPFKIQTFLKSSQIKLLTMGPFSIECSIRTLRFFDGLQRGDWVQKIVGAAFQPRSFEQQAELIAAGKPLLQKENDLEQFSVIWIY